MQFFTTNRQHIIMSTRA